MAEEFQAGICRGNWWNQGRSNSYDGPNTTSVSCSAGIGGGEAALSWTADGKARSCDEPSGSASGSSITLGPLTDSSTMQIPGFGFSPSIMDWTQPLLTSSSGRAETSFHAMLQDDLSSRPFFHHDPSIDTDRVRSVTEQSDNPFKIMNHFLVDQHHLSSGDEPSGSGINNMFDPDMNHQPSIYDNRLVDYQSPAMSYGGSHNELSQPSWPKFSQLLKASPPNNQSPNQLQFLNNTPFWNASATAQIMTHTFDQKSNCSKSNSGGARDSSSISSMAKKGNGSEPASKKPRMETPSPLPTFKVRKEKLGDRITALQQLVSPFGKTDTASVLHEAIEYIKFLHEQVNVLSTPYLKNGHPMQHQQNPEKSRDDEGSKQDLRSRGLCLVPVSSTYPVASETQMDFWNPTFGGTYR